MSAPELVAAQQAVDRGRAHAGDHEDRVERRRSRPRRPGNFRQLAQFIGE